MKYVINACFGGFGLKDSIAQEYGLDQYAVPRDNEKLIELVESGVDCGTDYSKLIIVNIPDNATDYEINDYDGYESIVYVVNGKIKHLYI